MRVLAIRGRNLASIAGDFAVELEAPPLAGVGLFAITGPTGAGKSTILDALCLALYDAMPRLPGGHGVMVGRADEDEGQRVRSTDVRSILRRGASDGYAEVDFVGGDHCRYRARWVVRRARLRAEGKLQPQEMSLVDLDSETRIGDTKSEVLEQIARRIGLSFEQFRRSVLLAQGDFAALLRAGSDERSSLLERITGTGIYTRLSVAAYRRADVERQALAALHARQADVVPLPEEERTALEEAQTAASLRRAAAEQRVADARQAVDWHARDATLAESLRAAEAGVSAAQDAWEGAAERRLALENARAIQPLRPLHEAIAVAETQVAEARARLDEAVGEDAAAGAAQAQAVQDGDRTRAAAAEGAQAVASLEAQLRALDVAARRSERAAAAAQRVAVSEAIGVAAQLVSLRGRTAQAQRDLVAAGRTRDEAEAARPGLAAHLATVEARLAEARHGEQVATAAANESAEQMRGLLAPGEPCPVCGATEHPWAHGAPALDVQVARLRERVAELDRERIALVGRHAEAVARGKATAGAIDALDASLRAHAAEHAALQATWDALAFDGKRACDVDGPAPDRALQGLRAEAEGRFAAASAAEAEGDALAAQVAQARTVLDALRAHEQGAALALVTAQGRVAAARQAVAQGRADAERRAAELATARSRLAAALSRTGITAEALAVLLARDETWLRAEEAALQALGTAVDQARAVLGERQRAAAAHAERRPAVSAEEAAQELAAAGASLGEASESAVRTGVALRTDDERRLRTAELAVEVERQAAQSGLWESMNELIGSADGRKFRAYAQSLTLEALVVHANAHLADLARRYRLQRVPGSDLELQIVDRDMGDEVRSVHSLSGGESFLVSLALALGLASLSSQSTQVESLFIDEGFGTLDPETLDVAIASLDALQSLGRKVGVISHVPTLVERVGVQVRVAALGGGRSAVRVSAGP